MHLDNTFVIAPLYVQMIASSSKNTTFNEWRSQAYFHLKNSSCMSTYGHFEIKQKLCVQKGIRMTYKDVAFVELAQITC